jgi:hypothetical protein
MHRALFTNWKFALLWAVGISASVAAFFAEGGGHEQLEASAEQIRDKRSNPYRQDASEAEPAPQPTATAAPVLAEDEAAEPEFGEPMFDPSGDGEAKPAPAAAPAPKPTEGEEAL